MSCLWLSQIALGQAAADPERNASAAQSPLFVKKIDTDIILDGKL